MSQTAETDFVTECQGAIDEEHLLLHKERIWVSGSTVIGVAAAGITNFLLRVPAVIHAHFTYRVESNMEVAINLYEGPTITNVTDARPPLNAHRGSLEVTAVLCYSESVIGVDGTYMDSRMIGAAGRSTGGASRSINEWVGEPSEDYLLTVETFAVNGRICVTWRFYEE